MSSENGWRGGEQQLAYLVAGLSDRNVKNIMAVKAGSGLEEFSQRNKIPVYTIRFSNSLDLISAYRIQKICQRENIDLIHLHSSKAQGVGVLSAACGNRVPMVLSRRVAFYPGRNIFSRWKYNQRQIRRILCVSEKIRSIMSGYVNDGSKCVTVYSGIDLGKFDNILRDRRFLESEFGLPAGRSVILTIGAVDRSKDHFTFVDTIGRLVAQGKPVVGLIVGDGPLATELNRYVLANGLEEHVKFAGQRRDVGRILMSADLFLMTSREEGLGTSILDAFLACIPVVATETGGIPEIVRNMETGLLAPVQDAPKLCGQIVRLLSDDALRKKLVDQARTFVRNFSKEETSAQTFKVYQEVLSK